MNYHAKIAASHPGKMGDALYTLPVLRYIYESTGQKIDFYTSEYCAPLKRLFEYQECINKFIIPEGYIIDNMGCGVQPWYMPIPIEKYHQIHQLGFRYTPDKELHQFIAESIGIYAPMEIEYIYQPYDFLDLRNLIDREDYICIAPRGHTTYDHVFEALSKKYVCVTIGGKTDYLRSTNAIDATGNDMLETLSILAYSKGFVGLMSAMLVLANGFDIPKVGLNGLFSDMRHAIKSPTNYYPENPHNPNIDDIVAFLDKNKNV